MGAAERLGLDEQGILALADALERQQFGGGSALSAEDQAEILAAAREIRERRGRG